MPNRNVVQYTVGTYEEITPGIFHKLTGALTSTETYERQDEIWSVKGTPLKEGEFERD